MTMNVSREFTIDTLKQARKVLGDWVRELETPEKLEEDGKTTTKIYPNGVPVGLSVSDVEGIPVDQMRAELNAVAGMLEALVTSNI